MKREQQLQRARKQLADLDRRIEDLHIPSMSKGAAGEAAAAQRRALNAEAIALSGEIQRLEAGMTPSQRTAHMRRKAKAFADQYARHGRRERMIQLGVIRPNPALLSTMLDNKDAGGMA